MATRSNTRLLAVLRAVSRLAGVASVLGAASVLTGWALDVHVLKAVLPGRVAMNPVSALAFILAGSSLWLLGSKRERLRTRRVGRACALLTALVGLLKLIEYLFGWRLAADQLLFSQQLGTNRMAPNTALTFVLVGFSLAFAGMRQRRAHQAAEVLVLAAALVALFGILGHTYGVSTLYGVVSHVPMAFNTALAFAFLCVGILCAHPDQGLMAVVTSETTGGYMARRLLPAALVVPATLGWLRLAGEKAGVYETEFGVALMTVFCMVIFAVVALYTMAALNRVDAERAEAAEARRKAADEIRELYDNAPCGYHSLDKDGAFVAVNDTELRWLGYSREELVGRRRFSDLLTPDSRAAFEARFPDFKSQGRVSNLEFEMVRKDGSVMPVLLNATAIQDEDGGYRASRSTLFDVTELKSAQRAVRIYTDIVNSIPIGLMIWRLDDLADARSLRLTAANPAASVLLNVEVAGLIGETLLDAFPRLSEETVALYADVVRTGKAMDAGEIHYWDARLAPNYWAVKAFPLPDRMLGLAFENITRRKRAEDEIRGLNVDLEARVWRRTAELADANRELAEKNQELEMFVYSVSHDLRSPLVNLQGFSKELGIACQELRAILLDNDLPPTVRERGLALAEGDMGEAIRFIQTAVSRLSGIIDALLRLSRAGRLEYKFQAVEMNAIVNRVVESLRATMAEKGATVAVKSLPPAWGDPIAMDQVFANLIGNALNYLDPKRPGAIEVGSEEQVACGENGRRSLRTYYVRDNGLGIPEAYLPKVFQAFQRLHPEAARGEGMGLAIVRRIVERHGGRIWVESVQGEGTTFFVALPGPAPPDAPPRWNGVLKQQEERASCPPNRC